MSEVRFRYENEQKSELLRYLFEERRKAGLSEEAASISAKLLLSSALALGGERERYLEFAGHIRNGPDGKHLTVKANVKVEFWQEALDNIPLTREVEEIEKLPACSEGFNRDQKVAGLCASGKLSVIDAEIYFARNLIKQRLKDAQCEADEFSAGLRRDSKLVSARRRLVEEAMSLWAEASEKDLADCPLSAAGPLMRFIQAWCIPVTGEMSADTFKGDISAVLDQSREISIEID